LVLHS